MIAQAARDGRCRVSLLARRLGVHMTIRMPSNCGWCTLSSIGFLNDCLHGRLACAIRSGCGVRVFMPADQPTPALQDKAARL